MITREKARRRLQTAQITEIQHRQEETRQWIALFKAMGGGWPTGRGNDKGNDDGTRQIRPDSETNRETLDRIALIPVAGASEKVTLGAIADISMGSAPSEIKRLDRAVHFLRDRDGDRDFLHLRGAGAAVS